MTGRTLALVYIDFAIFPGITGVALTFVILDIVYAVSTVHAWAGSAIVDILLAMRPLEPGIATVAGIIVYTVDALAVV